jgi:hypothetical protein
MRRLRPPHRQPVSPSGSRLPETRLEPPQYGLATKPGPDRPQSAGIGAGANRVERPANCAVARVLAHRGILGRPIAGESLSKRLAAIEARLDADPDDEHARLGDTSSRSASAGCAQRQTRPTPTRNRANDACTARDCTPTPQGKWHPMAEPAHELRSAYAFSETGLHIPTSFRIRSGKPRNSRAFTGIANSQAAARIRSICRKEPNHMAAPPTACHAEGRGFESHHPLSGKCLQMPHFSAVGQR